MECLWLKMETAVWASSPQTLPKKQKSRFLVSYMPLACAPRATAAYARGGPTGLANSLSQFALTTALDSRRGVSLPDASTSQEPLHDRSALFAARAGGPSHGPLPATGLRLRSRCGR